VQVKAKISYWALHQFLASGSAINYQYDSNNMNLKKSDNCWSFDMQTMLLEIHRVKLTGTYNINKFLMIWAITN